MYYLVSTILLGFFSFINLVLAIAMNLVRHHLWTELRAAANNTASITQNNLSTVAEQLPPHLANFEIVFWLMFLFSAVGAIIWYIMGSHREEYESFK